MNVYFSNRIEVLGDVLKANLYSGTHPFTRRLLMVPSPPLKAWLMRQIAADPTVGIAAGLEVEYPDETLQKLKIQKDDFLPSQTELALAIEWEIRKLLKQTDRELFDPLRDYVGPEGNKRDRRLAALSEKLAPLFMKYGRYGAGMLADWEKKPEQDWQAYLWGLLYGEKSPFTYPYRELSSPVEVPRQHLALHVFGVAMPPVQFRYLQKVAEHIPLHVYQLSPCEMFWSDTLTTKESSKLMGYWKRNKANSEQQKELECYLKDCNPLLANFGRLGREMALQIEESQAHTESIYIHSEPNSLLTAVQMDMLLLQNPALQPKTQLEQDRSIQLHSSPTVLREVEVVHDILLGILEKHNRDDNPLTPQDIIVMAPDMGAYEPFIKGVFCPERGLEAQINDLSPSNQSPLVQGFLQLLDFSQSRWESTALLRLCECPPFMKKMHLDLEDVAKLREWIRECGIRWGWDAAHRRELMRKDHCEVPDELSETGTWKFGIDRLLTGLMTRDHEFRILPYEGLEASHADLLGSLIQLLTNLRADLQRLVENSSHTLGEWCLYLEKLIETYFNTYQEEGADSLALLFKNYRGMARRLKEARFNFITFKRHLTSALNQQTAFYKESQLNAVRFCSLLPMRTLPAKVVVLMGLQDGSYPRQEVGFSLNLMQKDPRVDYSPSQMDLDRYVFLEALLSARQYFILSYQNRSPEDFKEVSPSLLVTELFNYLDRGFLLAGEKPSEVLSHQHPLNAFHKDYFQPNVPFRSYSKSNFAAACAYYRQEKQAPHRFFPAFTIGQHLPDDELIHVDMKDLKAFAKDPLKLFFNKTLGIYLKSVEERQIDFQDLFLHDNLEFYHLKNLSRAMPFEEALSHAHKKGMMPHGLFKTLAQQRLVEEMTKRHDNFVKLGIDPVHEFQITFSKAHKSELDKEDKTHWRLPPLELQLKGKRILIEGTLSDLFPQGFTIYKNKDLPTIVSRWPEYLAYHCLVKDHGLSSNPDLLCANEKIHVLKPFNQNPHELLSQFLDYYFAGLKNGSPLMPKWVSAFIKEDAATVRKRILDELNQDYGLHSPYFLWHVKGMDFPSLEGWQQHTQALYNEMIQHWFPRQVKKEPYA